MNLKDKKELLKRGDQKRIAEKLLITQQTVNNVLCERKVYISEETKQSVINEVDKILGL